MLETFHGHYTWNQTSQATGVTIQQSASGTFTITIDMSTGSGDGTGQGTVDYSQTGQCSGHSSVDYTFILGGSINTLGNLTLSFGSADPDAGTTAIACKGSGTVNVDFSFTSVWPGAVDLPPTYGAMTRGTIGQAANGVTWEITLA